ncbi:MAG: glycogen/starch synthase [Bacteroidales bacterium]|jgi:starch synthase|nr:glycogen/starch synthase [Bacteroidales bacterium]
MKPAKVLFICQEIMPYVPETELSSICRQLPQSIQENGSEIRTFMPKYGCINERRNQLHEVIRLSGMNLIIDDNDHPLIIKVASIQAARMQVYFIDNDDFFQRKALVCDESGIDFFDNDERSIFFVRGVIETVRKLRWTPDIIHCHGWFSALAPLYIKKAFDDDPCFRDTKVVYSIYNDAFDESFRKVFNHKLLVQGIEQEDIAEIKNKADYLNLTKLAIRHSDGIIQASPKISSKVKKAAEESGKPFMVAKETEDFSDYSEFYDLLLEQA